MIVRETVGRVRRAGATGPLTVRADSGFWARKVIAACVDHGIGFSITVPGHKVIVAAIEAIDENDWIDIAYTDGGTARVARDRLGRVAASCWAHTGECSPSMFNRVGSAGRCSCPARGPDRSVGVHRCDRRGAVPVDRRTGEIGWRFQPAALWAWLSGTVRGQGHRNETARSGGLGGRAGCPDTE